MQRDQILSQWISRTFQAAPRHVAYLLQALSSQDKDTLLMRVYSELSGGGQPQYHGYTVDPYSPYARQARQASPAPPPGAYPPAQALQQQQQQWASQSSLGKSVMANLDQQHKEQQVEQLLQSDSCPIKCYAQCTLSWRFGSGCSVWNGGRCSNAAAVILKDEQGQLLDAHHKGMDAKIQAMSQDGLTSTAPLVPQAVQVAQQDPHSQGFVCVCQEHADKIAEWSQSTLPSLLQLGIGAAALGVTAWGGKKLYSMATANKERDEAREQFELIKKAFRTNLQVEKNKKVAAALEAVKKRKELEPAEVDFLRKEGLTLDAAPTEEGACTLVGQAPASKAEHILQQAQQKQQQMADQRLTAALTAYQTEVLVGNPTGKPWRTVLSPDHVQTLLGSPEVRAGLGI